MNDATPPFTISDPPTETLDETIARLMKLSSLEYERAREPEAKRLQCRVAVLDKMVAAERANNAADTKGQGRALEIEPPKPWPNKVDGGALLTEIAEFFDRHLVLPNHGATLLTLWSIHTHCFMMWRYTPRLHVHAVTKNSGKSRVLALVGLVAAKPLRVENITPSAVFRTIEAVHPTLLIDEADQLLPQNPELVGILNGGHEHGGQTIRTVSSGDNFEPRVLDTFAPVAIAGIGRLPGPLEDRSCKLLMKRARRSEMPPDITVESEEQGERLARQIVRWVTDYYSELAGARPDMGVLINRLRNNWQPLYAIAEIAGGDWPKGAHAAMAALTAGDDDDADSLGERLLADIRAVFEVLFEDEVANRREPAGWLASEALVERLVALEDRPWVEMGHQHKPLTKNRLARMVKPFGVLPRWVGPAEARGRGNLLIDFDDAFERHLPLRSPERP